MRGTKNPCASDSIPALSITEKNPISDEIRRRSGFFPRNRKRDSSATSPRPGDRYADRRRRAARRHVAMPIPPMLAGSGTRVMLLKVMS